MPIFVYFMASKNCNVEDKITTDLGTMFVVVQGDRNKPAIFTYHDIGLNHVTNFQAFLNYADTPILIQSFCIYHINAPGQEEDAITLPTGYIYPTMDQLAEMLTVVMEYYGLKHFIGFGVGAGANILARFALQRPDCVDGLFLINCTSTAASWTEWGYQKLNAMNLRNSGMTTSTQEYLMWYHFGKVIFFNIKIATRIAFYMDIFNCFRCHVLLLAGNLSPHLEMTITMNSRLDPTNSTWMKLSDCGMPLEEQPAKVCEALHLFLQGLGYAANQFRRRSSAASTSSDIASLSVLRGENRSRQNSLQKDYPGSFLSSNYGGRQEVHIVENPINIHNISGDQ
ncbi:protein NDRG3-like [Centruroides sculpturatus]|uniref:protein NDRG3-like n=1 Tax=Centruroides sculpturatus TaxID=218467 RepID=UPI000C6DF86F|nr:protein NDRG3-like [Centruroides sculpturatus]